MRIDQFSLEDLKTRTFLNFLGLHEILLNAAAKLSSKFGWHQRQAVHTTCLKGCTLITGGNAGVGRATAEEFVKRGSDVMLACRNLTTAKAAAAELRQLTPYPTCTLGDVDIVPLDLASLKSVKSLVSTLVKRNKAFERIILNAGIMAPPVRSETLDGFEQQFQVNFLSQFALCHELLRLAKSQYKAQGVRPRCVFLSSLTHYGGATLERDLEEGGDLQGRKYNPFKQYAISKLSQLLAAKEFNRRLDGEGSFPKGTAVACHPGIVDTGLARQFFINEVPTVLRPAAVPLLQRFFFPLFLRSPKDAADCVMIACTGPDDVVAGNYIQDWAVAKSSAASNDARLAAKLWRKAEELASIPAAR